MGITRSEMPYGPGGPDIALSTDDPVWGHRMAQVLRHLCLNVVEKNGGAALIQHLATHCLELVLTVERPFPKSTSAAGSQVLAWARDAGLATPFIIFDAEPSERLRRVVDESRHAVILDPAVGFVQLLATIDDLTKPSTGAWVRRRSGSKTERPGRRALPRGRPTW